MAAIGTVLWPLAGITFCGVCGLLLRVHPAGRDRRFYRCPGCVELHPADPAESLVVAAVRERDWIRAQHTTSGRDGWQARWANVTAVQMRSYLTQLVDRITLAPTEPAIEVWWQPAAVLPHDSPWLGRWRSPRPDRAPPVRHR
jgi:hypothetical protein